MDEQHVALRLLYFLHHVEEVCALLLKNLVHLSVVIDYDLILHVGFWRAELELYEAYASLLNARCDVIELVVKEMCQAPSLGARRKSKI